MEQKIIQYHGIKQKYLINHFTVQFGFEIPVTAMSGIVSIVSYLLAYSIIFIKRFPSNTFIYK